MSSPSFETGPVAEEADHINWAKVIAVSFAALVGFAISIGFANWILSSVSNSVRAESGLAEVPKAPPADEVGIVNQRLFVMDPRAALTRDAQLKYLHSYGWVDRSKKTIHIPIGKAMEMMLAKQGAGTQQ
jgi:hypothetical protein